MAKFLVWVKKLVSKSNAAKTINLIVIVVSPMMGISTGVTMRWEFVKKGAERCYKLFGEPTSEIINTWMNNLFNILYLLSFSISPTNSVYAYCI